MLAQRTESVKIGSGAKIGQVRSKIGKIEKTAPSENDIIATDLDEFCTVFRC